MKQVIENAILTMSVFAILVLCFFAGVEYDSKKNCENMQNGVYSLDMGACFKSDNLIKVDTWGTHDRNRTNKKNKK